MYIKEVLFFSIKGTWKGYLFCVVYKKVRGWSSGRSLPVQNFVEYPPRMQTNMQEVVLANYILKIELMSK